MRSDQRRRRIGLNDYSSQTHFSCIVLRTHYGLQWCSSRLDDKNLIRQRNGTENDHTLNTIASIDSGCICIWKLSKTTVLPWVGVVSAPTHPHRLKAFFFFQIWLDCSYFFLWCGKLRTQTLNASHFFENMKSLSNNEIHAVLNDFHWNSHWASTLLWMGDKFLNFSNRQSRRQTIRSPSTHNLVQL